MQGLSPGVHPGNTTSDGLTASQLAELLPPVSTQVSMSCTNPPAYEHAAPHNRARAEEQSNLSILTCVNGLAGWGGLGSREAGRQ